jgi:basic amino acid/polyamine antiporter, APA family
MNLFRKKSIQALIQEAGQKDVILKKDLAPLIYLC